MDPEKRFTCAQLLQHPYFDSFINEFEREKKEQLKHLHREQQKLIQQQQQQTKTQANVYGPAAGQTRSQNPGVSCLFISHSNFQCSSSINALEKFEPIFRFCFQHFPSLSRNQDHEGNNTPASDDRPGRNFHLPNICTSASSISFSLSLALSFGVFSFFFLSLFPPPIDLTRLDFDKEKKRIKFVLCFFRLENSAKFDGHYRGTILNCSYNIK